jgi:hypothetical protein
MNICRPHVVSIQMGLVNRLHLACETHGFVADCNTTPLEDERARSTLYLLLRRWQDHCLMHAEEKEMVVEPFPDPGSRIGVEFKDAETATTYRWSGEMWERLTEPGIIVQSDDMQYLPVHLR